MSVCLYVCVYVWALMHVYYGTNWNKVNGRHAVQSLKTGLVWLSLKQAQSQALNIQTSLLHLKREYSSSFVVYLYNLHIVLLFYNVDTPTVNSYKLLF
jgi:hypothetical protein